MTDAHLLRFPSLAVPRTRAEMPELATRLVGLMFDRIRETTRFEQQRDRLAALGKLSAGLAHELNNPASAAKRASQPASRHLKRVRDASHELGKCDLTPAQRAEIERLEASLTHTETSRRIRLPPVIWKISLTLCSAATAERSVATGCRPGSEEISGRKPGACLQSGRGYGASRAGQDFYLAGDCRTAE